MLEAMHAAADAVAAVLRTLDGDDWDLAGTQPGQHRSDLAADAAAVEVLSRAGVGILSEESGRHHPDRPVTVVLDPLDGSTNALHRVPWYATSLCALDGDGPVAALVVNQASGTRFEAGRGAGARRDGEAITASGCADLSDALVGLSGYPPHHLGWRQYRALGAGALDLCLVACGSLDAYLDCTPGQHGPWDYLGGMLICEEAGATVLEGRGRPLVDLDHDTRRMPVAAATPALADQLLAARRTYSLTEEKIG